MKSIIILSGPVGAGKSTVAKYLVAQTLGPVIYIEGDKFWSFIAKEDLAVKKAIIFKALMRSMTVSAIPFVREGYQVILDFSIPPWYWETLHKIVSNREISLDVVVIRPGMGICAARAATRLEGAITDYTRYQDLYNSFEDERAMRYTIHDDESDAETIAEHISEGLNEGIFRFKP